MHKISFYAIITPNKRGMYMFWSNLFKKKDKENNKSNQNIANHSYSNIPSYKELTSEEQEYVSN